MPTARPLLRPAAALAAAALAGLAAVPAAQAAPAAPHPQAKGLAGADCFFARDWENSRAAAKDSIYLKVRGRGVYRVDLHGGGADRLDDPGAFLVTRFRGSDRVCAPIDLDLKINDHGMVLPLFPVAITRLTAAEVAAIPKKLQP